MNELTPNQIVKELDKYIIGQDEAKKSVAIALRNRYRRRLLSPEMRDEVTPKNIIMMGPTGVGKTEIARRLAKLVDAPFIKVEATKFTEVGYVGRDVESMVRDLVATSIRMVKQRELDNVKEKAKDIVDERLLDAILPASAAAPETKNAYEIFFGNRRPQQQPQQPAQQSIPDPQAQQEMRLSRAEMKRRLDAGELEDMQIEIMVEDRQSVPIGVIGSDGGNSEMSMNLGGMLGSIFPQKKKKRKTTVAQAREIFTAEESQKLIDMDAINEEGLRSAEQDGIIFLDEIDKIAGGYKGNGPDVSREGVQRDILPIVEGCTVTTKYGPVKTDFMLFIGAGAFHMSKVSDLIPELQGRFPIKVKLDSLTEEDFLKILTQPQNALIKQYTELLATEGLELKFDEDALEYLAKMAFMENETSENIGARRLYTVLEKVLSEISFYAPEYDQKVFTVTRDYVKNVFKSEEEDLKKDTSRFIL
ncbi:MAG: ATP-dependent protease ATPase subunit HslU [Eubacteriaceae bacterium]|nr:ATP-dependent protease ATPase subunit HslU [Eubacteriaceae bacterium]